MNAIDWQPIETAPKDGSTVMVWGYYSNLLGAAPSADNTTWGVGMLSWQESNFDKFVEAGDGLYRKETERDGYWHSPSGSLAGIRATHWAPMPDGPRVKPPREKVGIFG